MSLYEPWGYSGTLDTPVSICTGDFYPDEGEMVLAYMPAASSKTGFPALHAGYYKSDPVNGPTYPGYLVSADGVYDWLESFRYISYNYLTETFAKDLQLRERLAKKVDSNS